MRVDVNIQTWPNHPARIEYLRATLAKVESHLDFDELEVAWYCSAESEPCPERGLLSDELESLLAGHGIPLHWRRGPAELAASINECLRLGDAPYQLFLQDDFIFKADVELVLDVEFLESHPEFCAVRYFYSERTQFTGEIDGYRIVDMAALWPFSDGPHLRRRSMVATYGEQEEGLPHGVAEHRYHIPMRQLGAQVVCVPESIVAHAGGVPAVINDPRNAKRPSKRNLPC